MRFCFRDVSFHVFSRASYFFCGGRDTQHEKVRLHGALCARVRTEVRGRCRDPAHPAHPAHHDPTTTRPRQPPRALTVSKASLCSSFLLVSTIHGKCSTLTTSTTTDGTRCGHLPLPPHQPLRNLDENRERHTTARAALAHATLAPACPCKRPLLRLFLFMVFRDSCAPS